MGASPDTASAAAPPPPRRRAPEPPASRCRSHRSMPARHVHRLQSRAGWLQERLRQAPPSTRTCRLAFAHGGDQRRVAAAPARKLGLRRLKRDRAVGRLFAVRHHAVRRPLEEDQRRWTVGAPLPGIQLHSRRRRNRHRVPTGDAFAAQARRQLAAVGPACQHDTPIQRAGWQQGGHAGEGIRDKGY